jgi:DNA-binding NtrC family response regulator
MSQFWRGSAMYRFAEAAGDPVSVRRSMRDAGSSCEGSARELHPNGRDGVGKEVCARYLHSMRDKPNGFMALNCAAIG